MTEADTWIGIGYGPTQFTSFIRLHLFEGILSMFLRELATDRFLMDVSLDSTLEILLGTALETRPDFLGFLSFWFLAISCDRLFICFRSLTILMSRINLTVLVPSLAALDALEICEILAAFCPPPVRYWEIQIKSKAMVRVEMTSSQK